MSSTSTGDGDGEINRDNGVAFALDIDGVLVRGSQAIAGASNALKILDMKQIPYVFLTNDGSKTIAQKKKQLQSILDIPVRW